MSCYYYHQTDIMQQILLVNETVKTVAPTINTVTLIHHVQWQTANPRSTDPVYPGN